MREIRRARLWAAGLILALGAGFAVSSAVGAPDRGDATSPSAVAAARADGTPTFPQTTPTTGTTTTGPVPTVPRRVKATDVIKLPSAKRCARSVRIGLSLPSGVKLNSLVVTAGSRRIKRAKPRSSITLRVLPRGRFTIRVSVRTNGGQSLVRTRRFRPCA